MQNRIPEEFIKEGLELAKQSEVFGVPIELLDRDELLACLAQVGRDEVKARIVIDIGCRAPFKYGPFFIPRDLCKSKK